MTKPLAVRKGLAALVVATVVTIAYIWSDPAVWDSAERMTPILWGLFFGTNGLFVALLVLAWRRHNWARWAVVVWTILGVLAMVWAWFFTDASTTYDRAMQALIIAVELWGCYHLLSKPASSWFKEQPA